MPTFQTQGIILKKTDRGEADQLFSIYTRNQGKVSAIARGSKKISSKLNGHLQFFAQLQFMIAFGKRYDHIASVQIVDHFPAISRDLKKIVLATDALELVEKLTRLGQGDERIFNLLLQHLAAVDTFSFTVGNWQALRQTFVIKLLTLLGFAPPLDVISHHKKLDGFLREHLENELFSDKFLYRIKVLTSP